MGGKGSTTTGQLPPEVRGLFSNSSNQIGRAQATSPLSDYMGSFREGVAPLAPLERHSIGQAQSLFDVSNGPNAMALRSYMSLPDLAAAGPTTGEYTPSNMDLRYYMDFLRGPGYGQVGPEADYPGYGNLPAVGPEIRDPNTGNPRPWPGGGGGSGGGGDGGRRLLPFASEQDGLSMDTRSAQAGAPPPNTVVDPRGFFADETGPPGGRGFVGGNHTYVQFGPDGHIERVLSNPQYSAINPGPQLRP